MNIVILAAGQGKRMKSALPKVLQPLAGKPLLEHVLETAISLTKAAQPVVVIGHGAEYVNAFLSDLANRNPRFKAIKTVLQKEQKGTGHALLQTLTKLNKDLPTLVLYGDVPLTTKDTLQSLIRLADGVRAKQSALGLLTQNMENPKGYGRIVRDQDGAVSAIVEEKDASPSIKAIHEINTGIMVLPSESLSKWLKSLKTKNAQGEYYLTDVIAMAVRDGVPIRTSQAKNEYEILGVNSRDQLAALERQIQRQRAAAKANHLAYVGDSIVGARVNIGAGTITCNYDGVNKHQTIIEDDVFIGSDTQLVAPVKVGKGATLGAGTTLTKDAPAGKLTVSRAKQVSLDWQRPIKIKPKSSKVKK
ncbi:MAG: bifunctional N-acetylglucosamine-1-phosphate uridyltransferase/glucosamine-1-phosphate acetyltransferase [Burkholderiaceae bacterium]|nr:bifunctional N-acetylglucosamine-1-phosphate uridyltransferase/glucosamine-1-phosphate acetyltransferase [Burkholderiaceae bacterium]